MLPHGADLIQMFRDDLAAGKISSVPLGAPASPSRAVLPSAKHARDVRMREGRPGRQGAFCLSLDFARNEMHQFRSLLLVALGQADRVVPQRQARRQVERQQRLVVLGHAAEFAVGANENER